MLIEHQGKVPSVDPTARVAPTAVLCGDVVVGPGCDIAFGAVLTAADGQVTLGERVIVREHATIRATSTHPLAVGAHSLIGPNAMLRGCDIADGVGRVGRDGVDMDMTDLTARLADALQRHRDDRIV